MRRLLILLALALGFLTGTAALMQLVRAPSFLFFALGLAALEWAPWALLIGVLGAGTAWAGQGADAAGWRFAATTGLILNIVGVAVLGTVWMQALTAEPDVASNIPGVEDVEAGAFSLQAFLSRPDSIKAVERVQDVTYATVGGAALMMDVYRRVEPQPGMRPPALVVVHGGSWWDGDKGEMETASRAWAAEGVVVFDVAYRLAPEDRFPAAVRDVKCAVGYVKDHAARFGIDPERVVLMGRSAGAQIALVAAYGPTRAEPQSELRGERPQRPGRRRLLRPRRG